MDYHLGGENKNEEGKFAQMRLGCKKQEWEQAGSLSCTPKQSSTVVRQSRASAGLWGLRQSVDDANGRCMITWGHLYTACLRLRVCDSVIGSSENPNECLSSSSTPHGPCTAHRLTPVPPLQSRCKVRRDGIWRAKDPSEFKNLPSCCEGDCGKTSRKIWAEHKWWWQIIVEAVELGFLYAAQTWCTVFEYIKNLSLGLSWFGCI